MKIEKIEIFTEIVKFFHRRLFGDFTNLKKTARHLIQGSGL
jgi:hypothetical protein